MKFAILSGYQIWLPPIVIAHTSQPHHNELREHGNGKKFHQTAPELARVKEYSNQICQEYGSRHQVNLRSAVPQGKDLLIRKAISIANAHVQEEFIWEMEMHGYKVTGRTTINIYFTTPTVISAVTISSLQSSSYERIWKYTSLSVVVNRGLRISTSGIKPQLNPNTPIPLVMVS